MKINCKKCGKLFNSKPYLIKQGKGLFCERKCKKVSFNRPCKRCGKDILVEQNRDKVGKGKYCSKRCASKSRVRERSPRWKGGKIIGSGGYTYIRNPDHPRAKKTGYVREHILIAENALQRPLQKDEVIHHINEVKSDNRIENLYLFSSHSDHMKYHMNYRYGNCEEITKSNMI